MNVFLRLGTHQNTSVMAGLGPAIHELVLRLQMQRRTLLLALVVAATIVPINVSRADDSVNTKFAVGQMWSVKSTAPTTTKVIIGRIDAFGDKVAVSVSLVDVPIPTGMAGAGTRAIFGHLPFDRFALAASVDRLLATGVSPVAGFDSGYDQWKWAKRGVWTSSVVDAVDAAFKSIGKERRLIGH